METDFLLKVFEPEADYEVICDWLRMRGRVPIPVERLPKLGMLAIEKSGAQAAAAFVYMDNSGSGVCFIEGAVTRPGMTTKMARAAMGAVIGFLQQRVAELGYVTMFGLMPKRLAGEARRLGFVEADGDFKCLCANLETGKGAS